MVHRVCFWELIDNSSYGASCVLDGNDSSSYGTVHRVCRKELTDISSYDALCVLGEQNETSFYGASCSGGTDCL